MLYLSCVCYTFVHVCLLMPCGHLRGKSDLLAPILMSNCVFYYFLIGTLGQVWYLYIYIA